MANTPSVVDSQGRTFSVFSSLSAAERVTAGRVFSIYNFPSQGEQTSQARVILPVKRNSDIDVSEARVFAVIRGRIANPRLRVWTFTLDGHDFFVLRLGDTDTILYDTASEQWVDWDSDQSGAWRVNTGMTWVGGQRQGYEFGSSVVAGDDTFGVLWFLDPRAAWDDMPDPTRPTQQIGFQRIVTGQVLAKNRQFLPCYTIFLDADNYGTTAADFVPSVTLEISDDQGRTFLNVGTILQNDENSQDAYFWPSLGQITAPGRIFRVTDNGVFTRIDAMSMNDD